MDEAKKSVVVDKNTVHDKDRIEPSGVPVVNTKKIVDDYEDEDDFISYSPIRSHLKKPHKSKHKSSKNPFVITQANDDGNEEELDDSDEYDDDDDDDDDDDENDSSYDIIDDSPIYGEEEEEGDDDEDNSDIDSPDEIMTSYIKRNKHKHSRIRRHHTSDEEKDKENRATKSKKRKRKYII